MFSFTKKVRIYNQKSETEYLNYKLQEKKKEKEKNAKTMLNNFTIQHHIIHPV